MLTEQQGRILRRLARQTIEEQLDIPSTSPVSAEDLNDPRLREKRAVFVTLNKGGQLRGCIGSLVAMESILNGVRRHAVNAAFHDHRFTPVSVVEVPELAIDVSVLSEPVRLDYSAPEELVKKLRPGIDGVILKDIFGASATFLPQVWEQLPTPQLFLNNLCRKAGLPEDTWRNQPLEILTYQVQYFKEEF